MTNQEKLQFFATREERTAYIKQDWRNGVSYAIDHNPQGVYDAAQANWPDVLPALAKGAARNELHKRRMYEVITEQLDKQSDPGQSAIVFLSQVPQNPEAADTWLIKD